MVRSLADAVAFATHLESRSGEISGDFAPGQPLPQSSLPVTRAARAVPVHVCTWSDGGIYQLLK